MGMVGIISWLRFTDGHLIEIILDLNGVFLFAVRKLSQLR
jgi:hypothetical protein